MAPPRNSFWSRHEYCYLALIAWLALWQIIRENRGIILLAAICGFLIVWLINGLGL